VKFQGTVFLSAVVKADGEASDIEVIKRLPFGLTNKAVEAVRKWRFEPARDADGRPVAVKQVVEVSFHLY
jgi:TonB family protein